MRGILLKAILIVVAVLLVLALKRRSSPAQTRKGTMGEASQDGERASFQAARARLEALFASARRTGHDPMVEERDAEGPVSKFGGLPWLPTGASWPVCAGCEKPMGFFAQLNIASLPSGTGIRGKGLIQFFQCADGVLESDLCMETYSGNAGSATVRLLDSERAGANGRAPAGHVSFPARVITGWTAFDDFPCPGDQVEPTEESDEDTLEELRELSYNLDGPEMCRSGDKLGGWPYWVQNPEWRRCSECNNPMLLILQIDSEDNVPFMFGDVGVGHILQCPDHPHVLTWGWACY